MKSKKSIISIICAALLVTTFSGCGDTEEQINKEQRTHEAAVEKPKTPKEKFELDLVKIVTGINRYYDIVGQFPKTGSFNDGTIDWHSRYINSSLAKKWKVRKYRSQITIKPKIEVYPSITDLEIEDAYNNCLTGSSVANGCVLLLNKEDNPITNTELKKEIKTFQEDLEEIIYGVKKYYDIVGTYPLTGSFKNNNSIWSGTYLPPILVNRWSITKYENRLKIQPNEDVYVNLKEKDKLPVYEKLCDYYYDEDKTSCPFLIIKEGSLVTVEDRKTFSKPELQLMHEIKVMKKGIESYQLKYKKYPDYYTDKSGWTKNKSYKWNRNEVYIPNSIFENWIITKDKNDLVIILKELTFRNVDKDLKKTIFKQKCKSIVVVNIKQEQNLGCVVISTKKKIVKERADIVTMDLNEKKFLKEINSLIKGIKDYRDIYKSFPPTGSLNMPSSKINATDFIGKEISQKWWLGNFFGNMLELEPKEETYPGVSKEFMVKVYFRYCDNEKNKKVCVLKK